MALHHGPQRGALDQLFTDGRGDDDLAVQLGALQAGRRMHHGGQRPLHVGAAASVDTPVDEVTTERIHGPGLGGQHVDRVHVGVEKQRRTFVLAPHNANDVAGGVDLDLIEQQPPHLAGDAFRHLVLVAQDALQAHERAGEIDERLVEGPAGRIRSSG